ncbi:MAG: hypothetical protein IKX14_02585, partial [Neisseriaceae bacterium]|nr:hypothetical protein [Neisseriaceae bacterium]
MDAGKLEEAEERFFIMDSQPNANQEYIFNYLATRYGQDISDSIKSKYTTPQIAPQIEKNGGILQQSTLNPTEAPKAPQKPAISVSTLEKYIKAGIKLIPTKPNQEGNFYQLKKDGELIKIDSLPGLKYWIDHGIERFIFIPKEAGFLCFDLDRNHGDGVDGVNNLYSWLKDNGLEQIPLFKNLDGGSFPTYTTTASGGIHLYYRSSDEVWALLRTVTPQKHFV